MGYCRAMGKIVECKYVNFVLRFIKTINYYYYHLILNQLPATSGHIKSKQQTFTLTFSRNLNFRI